jgi:predicted transcriptional regulator
MDEDHAQKTRGSAFGQLLAEKRAKAGLSLAELAELARLPLKQLEAFEGGTEVPSFDVCYRLAEAINSRHMQGFMIHDLWQAASIDRAAQVSRSGGAGRLPKETPSETNPKVA